MPHMDEGRLQAWLDGSRGGLSDEEREEVRAHVEGCEVCGARVAELRTSDAASRDLLGALAAAEPAMPDFSEIVARSGASGAPVDRPHRTASRRLPLQWAASVVLAIGVGWMANEVVRTEPGVVTPTERALPGAASAGDARESLVETPAAATQPPATESPAPTTATPAAADAESRMEPPTAADPETRERGAAPGRSVADPPSDPVAPREIERARSAADAAPPSVTWLSGRVTDDDGRPIENVVLTLTGTNTTGLSGPDGRFRLQVPPDSVAPDTRLTATYIGYAQANRSVPVGVGELSVGDLRLQQRAVQLEGVVVTGTAIAAERRELAMPDAIRVDGAATWDRVGADQAEAALGGRPLRLPGADWTEIGALTVGNRVVIRVVHETTAGGGVVLYQARSPVAVDVPAGVGTARRTTDDGLHLLATGALDAGRLADLLARAEPIAESGAGVPPRPARPQPPHGGPGSE